MGTTGRYARVRRAAVAAVAVAVLVGCGWSKGEDTIQPVDPAKQAEAAALVRLGNANYHKRPLQAFEFYNQAIAIDPNNADAYHWQGTLLASNGDNDGAIAKYQKAVELKPDDDSVYYNWGLALSEKKNYDGAITKYKKVVELKPDHADAYLSWGVARYWQKDYDGAIAKYQKAVELKPDYSTAYFQWGLMLYWKGDYNGAIAKYKKALSLPDLDETSASAHILTYNGWGLILDHLKEYKAAIEKYEQALKIDSTYTSTQNNLAAARSKLAALKVIDDRGHLPTLAEEPRLPALRGTVLVLTQFDRADATERGAAWVVKRQGQSLWLVTAAHVLRDKRGEQSKTIQIEFFSNLPTGKRASREASIVHIAPVNGLDLALLKVDNAPDDIQPLKLRTSSPPRLAEVYAIGHPEILDATGPWQTLPSEITSVGDDRLGLSSSVISPGSSGGPILLKDTNEVVGLVTHQSLDGSIVIGHTSAAIQKQLQAWGIL